MAAPPLSLTPAETQAFAKLFAMADPGNTGVLSGDHAVRFFEGFHLPTITLGEIWSIADNQNEGYLTRPAFDVALRLIARAQRGESVSEQVVHVPGAPPTYEGVSYGAPAASAPSGAPQPSHGASSSLISPEDKARFARIFAMVGPTNGVLSGQHAKDVFMKSKLPYAKLGEIWNLADTQQRGALDQTDFIIGMHYIQATMNGTLSSLPASLPPGIYESARDTPSANATPAPSSTTTASTPAPSVPPTPYATGPTSSQPPTPMTRAAPPAPPSRQATGTGAVSSEWEVTPSDKQRFDEFFDQLDSQRVGYVEGSHVVPFFLQSGLDESTLAHIWDLADLTQDGVLTRDEFAVAMHLINEKVAGKPLPQQLPPSMLPPSMRAKSLPPAVNPHQTETQRELFSLLDTDVPSSTMSPIDASSAFGTSPMLASAPTSTAPPPQHPHLLEPGSDTATTSRAAPSAPSAPSLVPLPTSASRKDTSREPVSMLDEPLEASASAVAAQSSALEKDREQTQAALKSAQQARAEAQRRREEAETRLEEQKRELAELEEQLARAKKEHERETASVTELGDKVRGQAEESAAVREAVIREESELSALRTQKAELEQQLLQDREAGHKLKRQLESLRGDTDALRAELQRLGEEAKKVAELNAAAERDLDNATQTLHSLKSEHTSRVAQLSTAQTSAPRSSQPVTPAAQTPGTRRLNPFDAFADALSTTPYTRDAAPTSPAAEEPNTMSSIASGFKNTSVGAAVGAAVASISNGAQQLMGHDSHDTPRDTAASSTEAPQSWSATPPPPKASEGPSALHAPPLPPASDVSRSSASQLGMGRAYGGEYDDEDDEEGPEDPDGGHFKTPEGVPVSRMGTFDHGERQPSSGPSSSSARDAGDMAVPGGFPCSAPAPAPGQAAYVVDAPMPTSPQMPQPGTPAAHDRTQPLTASTMPPVAPSSASVVAIPPSSEPPTPSTQAGNDDFDAAFSRMGVAQVVHHTPTTEVPPRTAASYAPESLDRHFGASSQVYSPLSPSTGADSTPRAPVSTKLPSVAPVYASQASTGAVPAYLQSTAATSTAPVASTSGGSGSASAAAAPTAMPMSTTSVGAPRSSQAFEDNFVPSSTPSTSASAMRSDSRPTTPPQPGDIGPVRQLCQMGFSRSQVMSALEQSGYRTEGALERLLSGPSRN